MVLDASQLNIITASSQVAQISTTDMGSVGMQLSGTWTGTLLPQVTVDGVNWITITIAPVPAAAVVSSITSNGIFQANVSGFKSFRLSSQVAPPWTGTATISLQATPTTATISELLAGGTSGSTTVVQPTASLLNATVVGPAASGAAASGNPVQIAGVYNSTAPSPSTGQLEPLQLDSLGDLQINSYTAIAGESLSYNRLMTAPSYNYLYQSGTTAGVTVKNGAGILHTLTISTPVASSVITLYDNTAASGTVITVITLPATLLEGPMTLHYDVAFNTGLELVVATGASVVTISFL